MKLGRLSGRLDPAMLLRLKTAAARLEDPSGDPRSTRCFAEIEPRGEMELAKIETARQS